MHRQLICALLLTALVSLPMSATTFTVGNTNNTGTGSLRQAITDANGASGATAGSPHIIDATGISGTISLQSALPAIGNHIRIDGPGSSDLTITRGITTAFTVFVVNSGFTVTIDGMTITNGSEVYGGGIHNEGTLAVTSVTLSGNSSGFLGGGIYNAGTLIVTNSAFTGNSAFDAYGGGIFNDGGTVTVNNSTFSDNSAFYGGGICSYGTLTVTNSTFSGNDAYVGGGIDNEGGAVTVANSTIADNVAGLGGGLANIGGTLTLINSTVSGNYASGNISMNRLSGGGGIFNYYYCTVSLFNTIVAGNTSSAGGPDLRADAWSSGYAGLISDGYNIVGNTSGNSGWVSSDQQNVDPLLNALASNGGPTQTMALQSSSPAIDAGSDDVLDDPYDLTTDQRGTGYDRSVGSHVDIGAYESSIAVTSVSLSGSSPYCSGSDATISWSSSEVTSVDIDFSSDNGTTWTSIATSQTSGATGGSYDWIIPNSPGSNRKVRVSSAANSSLTAMSNAFSIDQPPTITSDPSSNEPVCPGTSVSFSASASGSTTVQWQISTDDGTTFNNIDGATSASLVISSATLTMDGYRYRAVFTNACASTATSAAATLSVEADNSAPVPDEEELSDVTGECSVTISSIPTASDDCAGTITGTTTDPLTYSEQGTYTVHWTYDDGNGNSSTQNQTVIVDDATAPVPDNESLPDITGECSVTITSAPTATDNCVGVLVGTTEDALTYTAQGTYTVHWTFTDGNGNTSTQDQTIIVDDITDPTLSVSLSPTSLWPPSNEMTTISITASASDNCGSATWVLNSISGDDGATSSDWSYTANTAPSSIQLRAYRTGSGSGRTYSLNFTASDGHENSTTATCYVSVPHSQSGKVVTGRSREAAERGFMSETIPNPFTASTDIRFTLPGDGIVTIRIYDQRGDEVAILLRDVLTSGRHHVIWNGVTAGGERASAGEYYYRIESAGTSETGQIIFVR